MSPAQAAPQDRPKRLQLDRYTYEVADIICTGGFGTVWLLRRPSGAPYDTIYGQTCAVKTFNADEDEQEVVIEQELGNWVSLNRSHYIVPLIKIVRLNFEVGALMEVMPGNLADYIRHQNQKMLSKSAVKMVLLDTLHGLDDARRHANVAHLDLKPQNLLLTSIDSPHIKISDWGISRVMSSHQQQADWSPKGWFGRRKTDDKTHFGGGTFQYMAPERFSGSWIIGPAADVFSLGIIAVQLLTGQVPTFDGRHDPIAIVGLIKTHEYLKRAKELLHMCDGPLVTLILKMLDPDPTRRPQDYPALISAVESI